MTFLSGERVALEPLDPDDDAHVAAVREARNHPEMRPTGGYETGLTTDETRELIRERREREGTAVAIVAEGDIAGYARAEVTDDRARVVELSVYVLPAHQGKGYGTDAVRTLAGYAFRTLNAESLLATVRADNTPSIRLFERLEFVREGTRRRAFYKEGQYHDVVLFGLLRGEFGDTDTDTAAETTDGTADHD
jgi:RimJ/RimL family protein N-acetyltransferase